MTKKKKNCQLVYDLLTTSYNELKEKLSTYDTVNNHSQKLNEINKELETTDNTLKDIKIIDKKEV